MTHRILLIEDDPSILSLMRAAFEREGFETFTADNGRAGLRLYHTIQPDLVITDIVMPEQEGMGVIMEIRRGLFDTPVIAISGGGEIGRMNYLRWAKELGADLVVRKPFRMSMLLWMAQQLLDPDADLPAPGQISPPSSDGPSPNRA